MICESCQQNVATVHLTEIVQKAKKETHLCESCAQAKGITHLSKFSVKDFLANLGKKGKKEAPAPSPPAEVFPPCEACGITFSEFRQSGRLGCHRDYEHFKRGLLPLLEKIHGGHTQHTGRIPLRIGERIERERLVARYKAELESAVQAENYEKAAELRDTIRSLEQVGGVS